jgi:type IX secretion system PorP/SprF family membrane protein
MRSLKGIFSALALTFITLMNLFAQQRPQYTQYIFNNYLLNPALSGTENYTDVKVGHRMQWAGINEAPRTSFVSAHWSVGGDYLWKNPLSLPDKGDDPMSRNYMQNYTASPPHHGIGIMAVADKAGPLSRFDAGFSYAYHLQLSGTYNLAVGTYVGLSKIALNVNDLRLDEDADPALSNIITTQFKPDLTIGTWFYGPSFFAGASIQQVIPQRLAFTKDLNYNQGKSLPHFFLTSGCKLYLEEDISFIPSFMAKGVAGLPISFDLNAKVSFKDNFWAGGSFRRSDSFSLMAGFNFKNFINLTYAYDITTSELNTASNGTHELVLGLQLSAAYKVFSGGRNWH